jgi:hypothetical protein
MGAFQGEISGKSAPELGAAANMTALRGTCSRDRRNADGLCVAGGRRPGAGAAGLASTISLWRVKSPSRTRPRYRRSVWKPSGP